MDGKEMSPPQVLAAGSERFFKKKTGKLELEEERSTELSIETQCPWCLFLIALHSLKAQLLDCPYSLDSCRSCNVVSDLPPTET